jgi:hypothetical protein
MWPFKKMQFASPEEFPEVVDLVRDKLRAAKFSAEADRLHYLVHEFVCTTSNELYGELSAELRKIRREQADLPRDIAAEIDRLIKSIDRICPWR